MQNGLSLQSASCTPLWYASSPKTARKSQEQTRHFVFFEMLRKVEIGHFYAFLVMCFLFKDPRPQRHMMWIKSYSLKNRPGTVSESLKNRSETIRETFWNCFGTDQERIVNRSRTAHGPLTDRSRTAREPLANLPRNVRKLKFATQIWKCRSQTDSEQF